ncbi:MAG: VOC family protein [Thermomicrobiales bacterium]|nr:VOC family protein [Thermomicrobiales bacterium]
MAKVSTYLNFAGTSEEAFNFYATVFGTQIAGIVRHGDVPVPEGQPGPSDELKKLVINIALPILADHLLMATDVTPEMGGPLVKGNNSYICLHPDSREEANRLFAGLSEGGRVEAPMADMFWGDYWGSFEDKFGVLWMINHSTQGH